MNITGRPARRRAARRRRRRTAGAVIVSFLTLAVSGCSPDARQPHLVLVTIDCLRADRVGAYGSDLGLTPRMDALAREGTVFAETVAPIGTTHPSHASMLTGINPRYHGVRHNEHRLSGDMVTATERLRDAGYVTGAFVSYKSMLYRARLDQGFETVSDARHEPGEPYLRDGEEVIGMAGQWLENRGSKPAFLWVHLFEPHKPYRVNEYSREAMQDFDGFIRDGLSVKESQDHRQEILDSPRLLEGLRILYNGEVRRADALVGRLLDRLETSGMLSDSVVAVTSDHGQGLGHDDNLIGHGPVLAESLQQVPLIVRDFRRSTAPRVDGRVGLIDLAPTLVALGGAEPLPYTQGRSLVPALDSGRVEERSYFSEVALKDPDTMGKWYDPDAVAVYNGPFKLVSSHGRPKLYDLENDPRARNPVRRDEHPGVAEFLLDEARLFLDRESLANEAELDEAAIEELKSLGYIQ